MRALIVGAGGQVGRALTQAAPAGWIVAARTRAELDILDAGAVAAVIGETHASVVINAAAYTAVDKAENDADEAWRINAKGPEVLAQASRAAGARLVHISTDFVFDGTASTPYATDAAVAPLGAYGASKAAGEAAVIAAAQDSLIVRTAWVYGAMGANFMLTMLRVMAGANPVRVVCDQVGTPTHTRSLAGAIWGLLGAGASGIHHFTDAGVASWYDFAVAIAEEATAIGLLPAMPAVRPIPTWDYPTPAARPAYSVLDKSAAYALLGDAAHWRAELRTALAEVKSLRHV